uniref:Lysosome-associated membrane glycoprotein 1 n=1 Tax=Cynoglossus semilaevis TaxID=244447 RepID=A0A3P8UJD1_CYNSE
PTHHMQSKGVCVCVCVLTCCVQAVTFEVTENNSTCIKAELSASFLITYNTSTSTRTAQVPLPDSARVDTDRSTCGTNDSSPRLLVTFGPGHGLGLSFATNTSLYSVTNLTVQFNLSDSATFPEANSSGENVIFSMSVRAMFPSFFFCTKDRRSGISHSPAPAPAPSGTPESGFYSVKLKNNTVCLLAQMGLQFNISYLSKSHNEVVRDVVNLDPSLTNSSGSCDANRATLVLTQDQRTILNFTFSLNSTTRKYHLSGLALSANWSDMTTFFTASDFSLDYLRSTLGLSYMCNAEQTLVVDANFSLNTFKLQIQPFQVTTEQFATAEECQMDQDQMLIPIIVGAALAGLVLIVLIAYLIGRKRSQAGYQTI